jgi:hypothetical protein
VEAAEAAIFQAPFIFFAGPVHFAEVRSELLCLLRLWEFNRNVLVVAGNVAFYFLKTIVRNFFSYRSCYA